MPRRGQEEDPVAPPGRDDDLARLPQTCIVSGEGFNLLIAQPRRDDSNERSLLEQRRGDEGGRLGGGASRLVIREIGLQQRPGAVNTSARADP